MNNSRYALLLVLASIGGSSSAFAQAPDTAAPKAAAPQIMAVSPSDESCTRPACSAAVQKAVSVLTGRLGLKPLQPSEAAKGFKRVEGLKSCAGLPFTDTADVYRGASKGDAIYVAVLKGELSGTTILLGSNCDALAALSPIPTIILSYLVEGAPNNNVALVRQGFLPTELLKRSPEASARHSPEVIYKTSLGRVQITFGESGRTADGKVYANDGNIIYAERFEFADSQ
jgi:hypothetical protein